MEEQVPADWDGPEDTQVDAEAGEETRAEPANASQETPDGEAADEGEKAEAAKTGPKWLEQGHEAADFSEPAGDDAADESRTNEPVDAPDESKPKSASPIFHAVPDEGISKASAAARFDPSAAPLSKAACGPPPQSVQVNGVAFSEEGASKAAAVARQEPVEGEALAVPVGQPSPVSACLSPPPPPGAGALAPAAPYPPGAAPPGSMPPAAVHGQYPWPHPQVHPMSRPPHYPPPPGPYAAMPGAPPGMYPVHAGVRPPVQPYGATPGMPPPGYPAPIGVLPARPPPGNHHSTPPAAWVGTRPSSPRKESHRHEKHKKDKHKHDKHDKKKKRRRSSSSRSRHKRDRRRHSSRQSDPVPTARATPPPRPQGYNVFISNIPADLTAMDIAEALSDVSEQRIEAVDLFRDARGCATGEALVVFATYADACNTVARYHGGDLNGKTLNVVLRP